MNVIWTLPAKYRLKEIYLFYKHTASSTVAKNIARRIFETTRPLSAHPKMGNKEEYHYLVKGNYKILYKTIKEEIYITDVFDCRQNPEKMKTNIR